MYRCYDDEEGLVTQEDKEAYVKRRYGRIVRYKRGGSGQATRSAGKRGIVNQNAAQPTVPGSQDALKQNLGASEVNPTLPPMQQGDTSIAPQWASGGSAPSNYYGTFGAASAQMPYANAPYWGVIGPGATPPVDNPWWR